MIFLFAGLRIQLLFPFVFESMEDYWKTTMNLSFTRPFTRPRSNHCTIINISRKKWCCSPPLLISARFFAKFGRGPVFVGTISLSKDMPLKSHETRSMTRPPRAAWRARQEEISGSGWCGSGGMQMSSLGNLLNFSSRNFPTFPWSLCKVSRLLIMY